MSKAKQSDLSQIVNNSELLIEKKAVDRSMEKMSKKIETELGDKNLIILTIMNGGLFGKGIGEGTLNSKVPEAHTDYILSVISEEFGVIIVVIIMLIYLILSFKVIKKIDEEIDNKVKLILLGCISLIVMQTFIHVGVNIRAIPTTGMTLPYLSYGGSSTIGVAILSGIILNFTKRKILK